MTLSLRFDRRAWVVGVTYLLDWTVVEGGNIVEGPDRAGTTEVARSHGMGPMASVHRSGVVTLYLLCFRLTAVWVSSGVPLCECGPVEAREDDGEAD